MVSKLENFCSPYRVVPRGPTLGTCAWYNWLHVYCYHISIFEVCGMTYRQPHGTWLKSSHTEFFLFNSHTQTTSKTKDLGTQFESNLKSKAHINDIVNRAHQRAALIYRSFLSRDTNNLILTFKTYVRPLLEYVSSVWSPTHVMLRAAGFRIISGEHYTTTAHIKAQLTLGRAVGCVVRVSARRSEGCRFDTRLHQLFD